MDGSNIEKFKKDFKRLSDQGDNLLVSIQYECFPKHVEEAYKERYKEKTKDYLKGLPLFMSSYQSWYSESKSLIKQLLPERLENFISYYEKPKNRKNLTSENYVIEDYLIGLHRKGFNGEMIVCPEFAIPKYRQQLEIFNSIQNRFESTLYDIRTIVQADLFDSELEAAKELNAHNFFRSSGALAGVILERHLKEVCNKHQIKLSKKNITISDCNDALKNADIIDVPTWRFIQHLGDIRNLCDHSKEKEPQKDQIEDLINGVDKITKTIY
jgi:hypothetical protein